MALAHSLPAASPVPRATRYFLARAVGYIGVCACCGDDICGEPEDDWNVRFVLAQGPDGRRRLHQTCLPEGARLCRPRHAVCYWDWQDQDRPAHLRPI